MSVIISDTTADSGLSFYDKASWYVCFVPVMALILGYAIFLLADHFVVSQAADRTLGKLALAFEFVVQLVVFALGIAISCNIRQHRRHRTIWLAGLGLLESFAFGVLILLVLALNSVGPC